MCATAPPSTRYSADMADEPEDENKRKFREALERKKANAGGGSAHKDIGKKQPKVHGPEQSRREFRRKSG
jgi:hypothetical protein